MLLYLFSEAPTEAVRSRSRVLVERLIIHRPHPWGLLITFIELIKNPRYNFWSKPFTLRAQMSASSSRWRARAWRRRRGELVGGAAVATAADDAS